jgi:integrase
MARRIRYQQGSVQRSKRNKGPDVWVFRWREIGLDGKSVQRKAVIGTTINLPSEAAAFKAAQRCASTPTNKPRGR